MARSRRSLRLLDGRASDRRPGRRTTLVRPRRARGCCLSGNRARRLVSPTAEHVAVRMTFDCLCQPAGSNPGNRLRAYERLVCALPSSAHHSPWPFSARCGDGERAMVAEMVAPAGTRVLPPAEWASIAAPGGEA